MGIHSDPQVLDRLERSVLTNILRCEPDGALATQLANMSMVRREFFGPHQVTYFRVAQGAFPASRNALLGGYTYARLNTEDAPAAFTLHTDEAGWLSHLIAFMDDGGPWPEKITEFEVFSTKKGVSWPPA
jgi:hypothetical protein